MSNVMDWSKLDWSKLSNLTDEEKALWKAFGEARQKHGEGSDQFVSAKNKLIEMYYINVLKIAKQMHPKYNALEEAELASYGIDGLYQAIDKFDPLQENKFKTYSSPRIRGSILDNIRKVDWVPRLVRQRHTQLNKIRQDVESSLGRQATDHEMAKALDVTLEDYIKMEKQATPKYQSNITSQNDDDSNDDGGTSFGEMDSLEGSDATPLDQVLRTEMCHKLLGKNFTKLERKIMYLHYYESMTLKEISQEVDLSESRISQMHAKIIDRLKRKMARNPKYCQELEAMLQ